MSRRRRERELARNRAYARVWFATVAVGAAYAVIRLDAPPVCWTIPTGMLAFLINWHK